MEAYAKTLFTKALVQNKTTVKKLQASMLEDAKNETLVLEFINAAGGLVAKGGVLAGFAIAGEDGRYVWADGRIDGNRVILSNLEIPCPSKVRYAWDDDPEVSLFNGEGLPASPFKAEVGK